MTWSNRRSYATTSSFFFKFDNFSYKNRKDGPSVTHMRAHAENRGPRTKHEKRLEKTPQELQSSPRRISVCQRVRNVM